MPSGQCYLIAVYLLAWKKYSHTWPVALKEYKRNERFRVWRNFKVYKKKKNYTVIAIVTDFGTVLCLQVNELLLLFNSEVDHKD